MENTDLEELGRELRAWRKAQRIPSAELARSIGVSPTYVWLIEGAKPRSGGEPSRPRLELLARWMHALRLDDTQVRRLLNLAGYFSMSTEAAMRIAREYEANDSEPSQRRMHTADLRTQTDPFHGMLEARLTPADAGQTVFERRIEESSGAPYGRTDLHELLQTVIRRAYAEGREEEGRRLLESYLRWLLVYLEERS